MYPPSLAHPGHNHPAIGVFQMKMSSRPQQLHFGTIRSGFFTFSSGGFILDGMMATTSLAVGECCSCVCFFLTFVFTSTFDISLSVFCFFCFLTGCGQYGSTLNPYGFIFKLKEKGSNRLVPVLARLGLATSGLDWYHSLLEALQKSCRELKPGWIWLRDHEVDNLADP